MMSLREKERELERRLNEKRAIERQVCRLQEDIHSLKRKREQEKLEGNDIRAIISTAGIVLRKKDVGDTYFCCMVAVIVFDIRTYEVVEEFYQKVKMFGKWSDLDHSQMEAWDNYKNATHGINFSDFSIENGCIHDNHVRSAVKDMLQSHKVHIIYSNDFLCDQRWFHRIAIDGRYALPVNLPKIISRKREEEYFRWHRLDASRFDYPRNMERGEIRHRRRKEVFPIHECEFLLDRMRTINYA